MNDYEHFSDEELKEILEGAISETKRRDEIRKFSSMLVEINHEAMVQILNSGTAKRFFIKDRMGLNPLQQFEVFYLGERNDRVHFVDGNDIYVGFLGSNGFISRGTPLSIYVLEKELEK